MLGQVYEAGILDGTGPWHLFRFSSVTGQPTRVSASVFDFGVAEIDEAHTLGVKDGQMYVSMSISNSTTHRFYYVNPAVGDASRVGTLTNFGVGVRQVAGIDGCGWLYTGSRFAARQSAGSLCFVRDGLDGDRDLG